MNYDDTFEVMMVEEARKLGVTSSMVVYDTAPKSLTINLIGTYDGKQRRWIKRVGDITKAELDEYDVESVKKILRDMGIK